MALQTVVRAGTLVGYCRRRVTKISAVNGASDWDAVVSSNFVGDLGGIPAGARFTKVTITNTGGIACAVVAITTLPPTAYTAFIDAADYVLPGHTIDLDLYALGSPGGAAGSPGIRRLLLKLATQTIGDEVPGLDLMGFNVVADQMPLSMCVLRGEFLRNV